MISDSLYEFIVTARCGSISKAAAELGIAQSAVSRHLSRLESKLGAKLLERDASGIALTDDGKYVLECARPLVGIGADIRSRYAAMGAGGRERDLLIGGLTKARAVSRAFESARKRLSFSGYVIDVSYLKPSGSSTLVSDLLDCAIDVAVTFRAGWERCSAEGVRCVELYSEAPLAIVEKSHRLSGRERVGCEALFGELFARDAGFSGVNDDEWHEFCRVCHERGFNPVSRVIGYERTVGMELVIPDYIMVVAPSSGNSAASDAERFSVLEVEGLSLSVVALTRRDDPIACRFVDEAVECLS